MIDEQLEAVRQVREEANRLRLACINLTGTASMLHLAFDNKISYEEPLGQAALLRRIK